ncbi:HIRAN domain-containing protein [Thiomicrorhabdus sp.]|uniref:HIRAN domain-containing protein n=1 Tax=Thiomicrorhabdus sp. TaxID=2039724 RepID=UPI002AA66FE4|nr:HIRAN domain-containing protein [Thiomicrorhabdus sp.]
MKRAIQLPIKGTFYYSAFFAMQDDLISTNTELTFKLEPDNIHDMNAIQIWLPSSNQPEALGLLLGYVPKSLSKKISGLLSNHLVTNIYIVHIAQQGKHIEIDCQITIDQAWLPYFRLLIQSKIISKWYALKRARNHWLANHFKQL